MVRHFMINGVKVVFPFDPYPSQMAMMTKIIQGLKRGQSCLLESPTGSGKSLALLCASLAWQRAEIERIDAHNRLVDAQQRDHRPPDDGCCLDNAISISGAPQFTVRNTMTDSLITSPVKPISTAGQLKTDPNTSTGWYDDDLDDFRCGTGDECRKSRVSMTTAVSTSLNASSSSDAVEDPGRRNCSTDTDMAEFNNQPSLNKRIKKPKIYFGTRTHKQIAQIVRELRRTEYRNAKMTVLASREHTCIHPQVSRSANKKEGCRELLDPANPGLNCAFHARANQRLRSQDHLQLEGIVDAWDLEDLVQLGRRIRACPFYSARNLKDDADIVFCPYNYLIEPGIRESLDIQLRGQVLILDEAHNIEDSCREAASFSVQLPQLQEAIRDLEKCGTGVRKTRAECLDMARMLSHICRWMEQQSGSMEDQRAFDRACTVYTGTDMVAHLTQMGVSPNDFPELYKMYAAISSEDNDSGGDAAAASEYVNRVVTSTMSILGSLFRELGFIYGGEMKHRDDFRVSLSRTMSRVKTSAAQPDSEGWLSSRRRRGGAGRGSQQLVWVLSLEFICLNPAVVFAPLGEMAHGIMVASGTLSPMSSFQSELGVAFPLQLEASHVIDMDQVFVAALCSGPRGGSLNATYRNSEQLSFQDELGEAVMGVCGIVPNGVLCFLPSYSMLDKLAKRWRVTGLWGQLDSVKPVLCEPRAGSEFAEVMQEFIGLTSSPRGAIMLAVCRGKLSEGIDFADNSARAVITVGIPYPNVKDEKVELKKQYNNINGRRGLLRGGEWYGVQAYRALNQALGRCIRHRYDWGAILLVDDRFSQPRGTDGLSRWVRSVVRHHRHFPTATQQLHEFVERMQRRDANTAHTVAAACCEDAKQPGEKERFPVITLLDSPPLSADSATPAPSIGSSLAPQPNDSPLDVSNSAVAARRRRDAIAVKRSRFFHLAGHEAAPAQTGGSDRGGVSFPIGRQVIAPAIQLSPDLFVDDDVLMMPAELPGAGNSNGKTSKSAASSSSQLTNSPPIVRRLSRHIPADRGLIKGKRGIVFSSDEEE